MSFAAAVLLAVAGCRHPPAPGPLAPFAGIDAEVVVAIADGDFLASTYADQRLAPADSAYLDTLLVWRPGSGAAEPAAVEVSNSVTGPPEVLAVSPDGRTAYVVERLGRRGGDDRLSSDLAGGTLLTTIDIGGAAPVIVSTIDVGPNPESIDVSPDGRMIAIVSNASGRSLVQLLPVHDGRPGLPVPFDLGDLGIAGSLDGGRGVTASGVFWRPDGRALAVTIHSLDVVAFFRLEDARGVPRLVPWGAPVRTGKDPFTGRFTPDGRHFLSLDWGRDLAATTLEGRLPTVPSRISVLRLADDGDASGAHRKLGDTETDLSSEGIAISPDGRLVAAMSMRGTALPRASARHTRNASVVLLDLDPGAGTLTSRDRAEFAGILPEGASFDRSGRHLLVTAFEWHDRPGGALQVFAIEGGDTGGRLVDRGRISTPHGVHHVVVR